MECYYIYTITDPRTNTIFYVGQSRNFEQRFSNHMSTNPQVVKIKDAGYRPIFTIVFKCSGKYAHMYENRFIEYFEKQGYMLNNVISQRRRNKEKQQKKFTLKLAI